MTPPTWSQVPARAAGLSATKAAKRPTRATDQMIKHVRAFPFRSDRLDNPRPPEVESAERIRRTTTGGHVARAIRGLFINRLPRDIYPDTHLFSRGRMTLEYGENAFIISHG